MWRRIFLVLTTLLFLTTAFANQLIIEPDMGRTPILKLLNQSQYTINLVMYGMTDDEILNAFIAEHKRGRTLQIILEKSPYKAADENFKAIKQFKSNRIQWHGDIPPFKLIHQKTLLIDDKKAFVMTFNFTKSAFKNDRNFALLIDDKKMLRDMKNLFSADWNRQPVAINNDELIISPDNSRDKILMLINKAKQSINIYTPALSDFKMIGELTKAARRGVKIKILTSGSFRDKQKDFLQQAGIVIRQSKMFIHAKVMLIDTNLIMLGSLNFTKPSFDANRELSVIIKDKLIFTQLQSTFDQDWNKANTLAPNSSDKINRVVSEKNNTINKQIILQTLKLINKIVGN